LIFQNVLEHVQSDTDMDNSLQGPTELMEGIENSISCSGDPPNNTQAAVTVLANNNNKRPCSMLHSGGSSFEPPQNKKKSNKRGELKSVLSHSTRALNSITEACSKGMDKKGSSAAPDGCSVTILQEHFVTCCTMNL
jgi:hypothetical protein